MMVIFCGLAILRYVLACVIRKEPLSRRSGIRRESKRMPNPVG